MLDFINALLTIAAPRSAARFRDLADSIAEALLHAGPEVAGGRWTLVVPGSVLGLLVDDHTPGVFQPAGDAGACGHLGRFDLALDAGAPAIRVSVTPKHG